MEGLTPHRPTPEQLGSLLEAAPIGILVVGADGRIAYANAQIGKLFGYAVERLLETRLEQLVPTRARGEHPSHRQSFHAAPRARAMGVGRDLHALRSDGTEFPVEIGLTPIEADGSTFVLCSIVDITERIQTVQALRERTEALSATLREREVLLQEIHHRVKNNLQIIGSLISMQVRNTASTQSRIDLSECKTRVEAIALIHEKLYQSGDFSSIAFADYAKGLVAAIMQVAGISFAHTDISIRFAMEDIKLPVAQAIPCGLVLNELVTNAIKHAFPGRDSGRITIELRRYDADMLLLAVGDDGIGLDPTATAAENISIGMNLIASLADQLNGSHRFICVNGTRAEIVFPESGPRMALS